MKWFLIRDPTDLEEQERDHLGWLCQSHATLAKLYGLVQRFRRLLHQRPGEVLEGWIANAQASGIPELAQFARGLLREHDWVIAGITHPASQGPTEGADTKLKRDLAYHVRARWLSPLAPPCAPRALADGSAQTNAAAIQAPQSFSRLQPPAAS